VILHLSDQKHQCKAQRIHSVCPIHAFFSLPHIHNGWKQTSTVSYNLWKPGILFPC